VHFSYVRFTTVVYAKLATQVGLVSSNNGPMWYFQGIMTRIS
jgi:hypothetical protein